jgi:hypothetical protein
MMILLSLLPHQTESGHPELLDWIKHQLDSILGLGPEVLVAALGLIIVAMPVAILILYAAQRRRRSPEGDE